MCNARRATISRREFLARLTVLIASPTMLMEIASSAERDWLLPLTLSARSSTQPVSKPARAISSSASPALLDSSWMPSSNARSRMANVSSTLTESALSAQKGSSFSAPSASLILLDARNTVAPTAPFVGQATPWRTESALLGNSKISAWLDPMITTTSPLLLSMSGNPSTTSTIFHQALSSASSSSALPSTPPSRTARFLLSANPQEADGEQPMQILPNSSG